MNQTRFVHSPLAGMDVEGRDWFGVVVKGTFAFPDGKGGAPVPAREQMPLVMADEHVGEPGTSAVRWESDFAFRKPACDVVLQGAAYAPGGAPVDRVAVGLRIGRWQKVFEVVGPRQWTVTGPHVGQTPARRFTRLPIGYDVAFGGTDTLDPDDPLPAAYRDNPVGLGFASWKNRARITGQHLPVTQDPREPVASPFETYRPMAFGPVGRATPDRVRHAGTYDDCWKNEVFPFLPADFDERYNQMVGPDQQIDCPPKGTVISLANLTPRGQEHFPVPETHLAIRLFKKSDVAFEGAVPTDTLIFDPELRRFALVWRAAAPVRRTVVEFTSAWVGPPTAGMIHARRMIRSYQRVSVEMQQELARDRAAFEEGER